MALTIGLLGKKLGMTQVFADDGEAVPVTVIQAGPCHVVGTRTIERDGYSALVLGFDEKPARLANKAELGAVKHDGGKPQRFIRELRLAPDEVAKYQVGQVLGPKDIFTDGAPVDVEGMSKGKGFQGVIKRHHMEGMRNSHGTHEYFRHGGSIGCRLTPQRVHKGKRMSARMGTNNYTSSDLVVVKILEDKNVVIVKGSVPGPVNGIVVLKGSTKNVKKYVVPPIQKEVESKNPMKASKKGQTAAQKK